MMLNSNCGQCININVFVYALVWDRNKLVAALNLYIYRSLIIQSYLDFHRLSNTQKDEQTEQNSSLTDS